MKIIYYSPHPHLSLSDPAGYATHMKEMINAFRSLGHEVVPVIMRSDIFETADDNTLGRNKKSIVKSLLPSIIWETLKDLFLLRFDQKAENVLQKVVSEFKPDLIYERINYLQSSGVDVARKNNIYHIGEINSPYVSERVYLQGRSFLLPYAGHIEKYIVKKSDKIVVVSSSLREMFTKILPESSNKILVTPNAINTGAIRIDKGIKDSIIDTYDLKDKLVIGFVGSIIPWHGVDHLISSYADAVFKIPDSRLMIVGDGPQLSSLKSLVQSLGISSKVIFTGRVNHVDVFNYIDTFSIAVMARSNWYGSPVKIFEYGALGKPIIAPDTIPVRDVMEHNITGILVKPDAGSLTSAIIELALDSRKRSFLGISFMEKVIKKHTWIKMAEMILDGLPSAKNRN